MQPPPVPTYKPHLRQSNFQTIGSYVVRWVWEPNATVWLAHSISPRSLVRERANSAIDWATMMTWERVHELADRYGWR